jgi:hypothetical protein
MLGVAGFAGYMTLLFAAIALWWALANVMDQGWAALSWPPSGRLSVWCCSGGPAPAPADSSHATADRGDGEGTARHAQGVGEEKSMASEPDQIRGEIHQTQQELSADVDAVSSLRLWEKTQAR